MTISILPSLARGRVSAPPSKSVAHRALIAAALAPGESRLSPIALSEDMLATMDCLTSLGAHFTRRGEEVTVQGVQSLRWDGKPLCCRESGSTLRFLIPLCLLTGEKITLTGSQRLMERPQDVYETLCRERGFLFEREEGKITLQGKLRPGKYTVAGNTSSQFITGLLFALSLLDAESVLEVEGKVESASYIDMTLRAMADFGVAVKRENNTFYLPVSSAYTPRIFSVEGDWSNAAFLYALAFLGDPVQVSGTEGESLQGDRVCLSYFEELKRGCATLSLADCPDLAPILFVFASLCHGAVFTDTRRLRIKESDRGQAMAEEMKKCGVELVVEENRILVPVALPHAPREEIFSHNDHRIAMAMAVLLTRVGGSIRGAEAVRKSYPEFFEELMKLGIEVKQ